MADVILDTSRYTVHELRDYVRERYDVRAEGRKMVVSVLSFGFKYGVPARGGPGVRRALPGEPQLRAAAAPADGRRQRGGRLPAPAAARPRRYLRRVLSLVRFVLPRHEREGRSYLTIAVGCTGGRHRSVMIANAIGAAVKTRAATRCGSTIAT